MTWDKTMSPEEYLRRYPDGPNAAAAAEAIAAREDEELEVTEWHGMPLYHCPLCPFASTDRENLDDHVKSPMHVGAIE